MTDDQDMALQCLIYGLEQAGGMPSGRLLFVNARSHAALDGDITCVQWFKPAYDTLSAFERHSMIEDVEGEFDHALLLFPKNIIEGQYLVARTLQHLKKGGDFFIAAENKAGGNRLQKIVQQFELGIVQQFSKHKSRVVQVKNSGANDDALTEALEMGSLQTISDIGFKAQAGVYGWDKIDVGSKLLLQHEPQNLSGKIADFGCGYGYLLQHIVQQNNDIELVYAIDADARALKSANENLKDFKSVEYLWADLTRDDGVPDQLDCIIMNPPFHAGKKTDSDIGIAFIRNAAASLKKGGVLYMVANNQLPYEGALEQTFSSVERLAQENGFKVFKAVA